MKEISWGEEHAQSTVNIIRNIQFVPCPRIIGGHPEEIISPDSSPL
jgi:hypothetical protein